MGGVWCKADKGQSRPYSPRGPFNTTISRWTDHVRQAYRKQKPHHQPPRPPQKPARSIERLTISSPTLVTEASSNGWKTATLIVPDVQKAPVPPPRKKRKSHMDMSRSAVSMDDLNRGSTECLSKSTISLPDKCHSEALDSRSSSSTLIVTPILESRVSHRKDVDDEEEKENIKTTIETKIEEEEEDEDENEIDTADQPEIIPIEKETLFSSRTLLHSNLGYVDKLSAISEVSAESGFDDKTDILKSSEGSGSLTSVDSAPKETGLNILAHIHNINNVNQLKENLDIREKTAVSKKEWLQNILKEDPEPYFIPKNTNRECRRGSEDVTKSAVSGDICGQPNSLPTDHLHLMNRETQTFVANDIGERTPPPTRETTPACDNDSNHSVLLDIIQKNQGIGNETVTLNLSHKDHKEESIFLKNTKTNIIYKSLSSDKLTDDYDTNYSDITEQTKHFNSGNSLNSMSSTCRHQSPDTSNPFNGITPKTHLSDYSFQTPKLVESGSELNSRLKDKIHNVTSFDFNEISKNHKHVSSPQNLDHFSKVPSETDKIVLLNGVEETLQKESDVRKKINETKNNDKPISKNTLEKRDSAPSSRRSSITDSLHEFEMSIYDMLKESKKNENSSDEEESLKTVK